MVEETKLVPKISINNFNFSYDTRLILNDLNLSVNRGEVLSIIGTSGSGKSTLLKCIAALLSLKYGDAYLNGQQYIKNGNLLFQPWEIRQNIIIVFQDYNLFPNYTVLGNIKLALEKVKKHKPDEANEIAISICEKLKIADYLKRYPNELSGGQAQRVALARSMVLKPQVLLLDEVTSAVDPSTILNIIKVIDEIKNSPDTQYTSIILVTHNIRFAIDYSDNMAFLHDGVILEEWPSKDFISNAQNQSTKRFIRDSKYFT